MRAMIMMSILTSPSPLLPAAFYWYTPHLPSPSSLPSLSHYTSSSSCIGARVFEHELLDGDWAINNANWQWLSCSRFFYQFGRCYSPVAFPKKYRCVPPTPHPPPPPLFSLPPFHCKKTRLTSLLPPSSPFPLPLLFIIRYGILHGHRYTIVPAATTSDISSLNWKKMPTKYIYEPWTAPLEVNFPSLFIFIYCLLSG